MKRNIFKVSFISLLVLSLLVNETKAQVISYDFYSFRLNNMFNANSAYAGKEEGVNVFLNAQTQNNGVAFSNKNFSGGIYSRISDKQALGAKVISDSRGAFEVLKTDLSYAYMLKIGENQKLNFGINMGFINSSLSTSRIQNFERLDVSDETLNSPSLNSLQFTAGAGLLYRYKKLEVSLSVPSLISTNEGITSYLNGAVFYKIKASEKITLTPWIAYQNIPVTNNLSSLFVKSTYQEKLWVQLGYQSNKTIHAMVGIKIDQLAIGYGYRFNNNEFNNIASGGHEVSIAFRFDKRSAKSKRTEQQSTDGVARLSKVLSDLKSIDSQENVTPEVKKEIAEIQLELSRLVAKGKDGEYQKEDEKAMSKLEKRLSKLKLQLSK